MKIRACKSIIERCIFNLTSNIQKRDLERISVLLRMALPRLKYDQIHN